MAASNTHLYFLLQRAAHCLKVEADIQMTKAGGITTAQAAAMMVIAKDGPVTQSYVAKKLAQRESAITTMTTRLIKAGYITKQRSLSDSRAWALTTTKEGNDALNNVRKSFSHINHILDSSLTPAGADKMAAELTLILSAFNDHK